MGWLTKGLKGKIVHRKSSIEYSFYKEKNIEYIFSNSQDQEIEKKCLFHINLFDLNKFSSLFYIDK